MEWGCGSNGGTGRGTGGGAGHWMVVGGGGGGGGDGRAGGRRSVVDGRELEVADVGQGVAGHDDMAGEFDLTLRPDLILEEMDPMAYILKLGQAIELRRLPVILIGSLLGEAVVNLNSIVHWGD